jgi:hypothetical protein
LWGVARWELVWGTGSQRGSVKVGSRVWRTLEQLKEFSLKPVNAGMSWTATGSSVDVHFKILEENGAKVKGNRFAFDTLKFTKAILVA